MRLQSRLVLHRNFRRSQGNLPRVLLVSPVVRLCRPTAFFFFFLPLLSLGMFPVGLLSALTIPPVDPAKKSTLGIFCSFDFQAGTLLDLDAFFVPGALLG